MKKCVYLKKQRRKVQKMKVYLFLVFAIFSAQAGASPLPSVLPDGRYSLECQSLVVKKDDERGVIRNVLFSQGTIVVLSNGDQTITKEVSTTKGEDGKVFETRETVVQSTIKSIGNNQYEEQATSTSRWADEDSKVRENKVVWRRVIEVNGNFEANLKVQRNDEIERAGFGETYTHKVMDGVYVVTVYIREGYRQEGKDLGNGSYIPSVYFYHNTSTCKYTIK